MSTSYMQLGKNGLSAEFLDTLRKNFKRHETVKISLLKNYSRDKDKIMGDAEKIYAQLGCRYKLLGYTLILKRQKQRHDGKNNL